MGALIHNLIFVINFLRISLPGKRRSVIEADLSGIVQGKKESLQSYID